MRASDVTLKLLRVGSAIHTSNVEAKFRHFTRVFRVKFDPNQPRVPAGSPEGGQWTDGGGGEATGGTTGVRQSKTGGAGDLEKIITFARRKRIAGSPLDYQRCLDLCFPFLERPQHPRSDRNTWDFHKCMNACLQRNL